MSESRSFEAIIAYPAWRAGVLPLLSNPGRIASGLVRRDLRRQPSGLLVHELRVSDRPPSGADYPPLADWIAVAVGGPIIEPDAWIARLAPRFAQLLVAVQIGLEPDRSGWRGWTIERGVVQPLAALSIVGPGMLRLSSESGLDLVESSDSERWLRVAGAVGEPAFAKLRSSRVALAGVSRTGTLAALELAALGVARLILFDSDSVERHNLDHMVLLSESDVGANKAVAVGRRLVKFRPDLAVQAVPHPLGDYRARDALGGVDLMVTCVDRDGGRLIAAQAAHERIIPHLDIGTGVTRTAAGERLLAVDVRLLVPGDGCIRCCGGVGDLEAAEYELYAPPGALPRRPPEPWNAGRLGSLITLNSLAVAAGVQSWLDLLTGELGGSIWHRLRWRPGVGIEAHSARVTADPGCPLCRPHRQAA